MSASAKRKIAAILDSHNIAYRLLPHREPVFTVEAAAQQRGLVREEMVKSVLFHRRFQAEC